MMVLVTPGRACTHCSATWAGVAPTSPAIAMSSSTRSYVRSVRNRLSAGTRVVPGSGRPARVYLPVRMPARSGLHGVTPRSKARAMGMRSASTVRCSRLYSICSAISGVQPCSRASYCACTHTQAGWSLKPM